MKMEKPKQSANAYGYADAQSGVESVSTSAQVLVPMICDIFNPRSVLDVGCGVGDWLSAFIKNGVERIHGLDGSWVPRDSLLFPAEAFKEVDFYSGLPVAERFDLAVCLEVAEHVSEEVALRIIDYLCSSSGVILFSAAIPGQGGHEHINERYQEYWIEQFGNRGYEAFDCIRPKVWMDERVSWWYQQNCLIFADVSAVQRHSLVKRKFVSSLVHPALYEKKRDPRTYSLKQILGTLPFYVKRTLRM